MVSVVEEFEVLWAGVEGAVLNKDKNCLHDVVIDYIYQDADFLRSRDSGSQQSKRLTTLRQCR